MKMKQFNNLVKLNQKELKKFVNQQLRKSYKAVYCEDGFVYAQGSKPILLVAHMDTVHKTTPKMIIYQDGKISSPQGIGGDDRCGIAMILEIIQHHNCSVLFTEDEEIGGIGAEKFVNSKLGQSLVSAFDFILEFDRKGSCDAVFYDCGNEEFEEFINQKYFKTNFGSFSDISVIAPALKVAAVNLSCGYYEAHTLKEYVVWDEMLRITKEAIALIDRADGTKFEYIEDAYWNWYDDDYAYYDIIGDQMYGVEKIWGISFEYKGDIGFSEVYAITKDEAIGKFLKRYDDLTYRHILDVSEF